MHKYFIRMQRKKIIPNASTQLQMNLNGCSTTTNQFTHYIRKQRMFIINLNKFTSCVWLIDVFQPQIKQIVILSMQTNGLWIKYLCDPFHQIFFYTKTKSPIEFNISFHVILQKKKNINPFNAPHLALAFKRNKPLDRYTTLFHDL